LEWHPPAQDLLEKVASRIPSFVRPMVRRVVSAESERLARSGGQERVTSSHVQEAFLRRTPAPMRPLLDRELGLATIAPGPRPEQPEFAVGQAMTAEEIDRFLAWEGTGRLGLVDAEGRPYVVPLSFVHERGRVYYHWFAEDGRKARAVTPGRQVCFEADWCTRDQLSYRSVVGDGVIDEVADVGLKQRILLLLAAKFPAYATGAGHAGDVAAIVGEGLAAMAEAVRIYEIHFERITGKKKGRWTGDGAA
jgi:nitroimidazol reductase NimA-like FMN-containing flavoprotein (pyridoxamine 5'-phosphate oxidase superfamily)